MREGFRALLASVGGILLTLGIIRSITGAWGLGTALLIALVGGTLAAISFFAPFFSHGRGRDKAEGG
ncbi:hypothetical protein BN1051_01301 [Arthrobacter saudimassiliensis]|uniref:Uncharacterized protein n=1 Tax=Arthrobacter saudimassiliensis TaxID=1461584 RepID=A0A078MRE4_9MICC|nr:hypothetical protein BN1051_01301 [Arthrobacter saudimassiliensis]